MSDLVRLECRVKPLSQGNAPVLTDYDKFFAAKDVRVLSLTAAVIDRATTIRARHGYKLADAIHLAAAVEGGCDVFLTNDTRLSSFPDLTVEVLP